MPEDVDLPSVYSPPFDEAPREPASFLQQQDADGEQYKPKPPKPKAPPLECGKPTPDGPCFLSAGHATPAIYPTPRYDASPEEIEKYQRARFGCLGRKPKESKP